MNLAADAATSPTQWLADWMASLDSPRRWTADPSGETQPDVAHGQLSLVFVSDREGSDDIYILPLPPADPAPPRRIVESPARDFAPRFSPDGKWIAYVSTLDDAFGDIWIVNVRSGKARRLTDRSTRDSGPVWMPGGKSILFTAAEGENSPRLVLLNVRSGEQTPFAVDRASFPAGSQPDVSPDGRWIAFIAAEGQRLALFDSTSGDLSYPTPGTVPESAPRFTSDGRALLLARAADDTNADGRHDNGDSWTVWQCTIREADGAPEALFPLTTSRYDARSLSPFPGGFFFASSTSDRGYDVFSFGHEGAVATAGRDPAAFAAMVRELSDQRPAEEDLLLCAWRQLSGHRIPGTPIDLRNHAAFEEALLLERLGRLDQAARQVAALIDDLPPEDELRGLARVEQQRISVSRTQRATARLETLRKARVQAIQDLESIKEEHSAHPRVVAECLLLQATLYGDQEQLAPAIAATDDLLEQFESFSGVVAQALLLRGRLQEQLGLPEDVSQTYERILREYPSERAAALEAARRVVRLTLAATDDLDQQRRLLNELIADRGIPPLLAAVALNRVGDLHVAEDRISDALDTYRSTVQRFPDQTEAVAASHFAQSRLLFELGRYGESVRVYERIEQRLRPRNDTVYARARRGYIRQVLLKGEAEWRLRDPFLARSTFASLLRYDSSIVEAWRGILRSDNVIGRIPETLAEIEAGLESQPDDPALRYARGLALTYVDGKEEAAEYDLERAALLNPASPYPHQTLGYLYEQRMIRGGDRADAERALREYQLALSLTDAELVPYNHAALLVNAGNAARLLGVSGLAQTYYSRRAQDPQPQEDPRTEYLFWRHAAESAFGAGDSAAAEAFYRNALETLPLARELDTASTESPSADAGSKPDEPVPGSEREPVPAAESTSGVDWETQKTELIDRRSLALQELGRYRDAADGFATVAERTTEPRARALARRNVGVNLYLAARDLQGDERVDLLRRAWNAFHESRDMVEKEGVISPKERRRRGGGGLLGFAAVVGLGDDTTAAGLGFDRQGELRLLDGFLGWIAEANGDPDAALQALHGQIEAIQKLDDSNKAYVLTQKAVLWSRVADLEERRGRLGAAAAATLESLAACHWVANDLETTNARGAAIAAVNLSRLWLLDAEAIPDSVSTSWLMQQQADKSGSSTSDSKHAAVKLSQEGGSMSVEASSIARLLANTRSLLDTSSPPPAAVLLPDVIFHQGLVALRGAHAALDATPDSNDPLAPLRQASEALRFAQRARSFFREVQTLLETADTGTLQGVPRSPQDREQGRRLHAAAILQEARALRLLGRNRQSEETADRGLELAQAWCYSDLIFAFYFESGLEESDPTAQDVLWEKAVEVANDTLPGQRSPASLARAARATLAVHFAARSAEQQDWEEAWLWSEWAVAQDLAADMDRLDPDLGEGKVSDLTRQLRNLRSEIRDTLETARRSDASLDSGSPSSLAPNLESFETRWTNLLDAARGEAPEVWALYSGQPLTLGDVIDFLDPETALVRLAWLDGQALVIAASSDGVTGALIDDSQNRMRTSLQSLTQLSPGASLLDSPNSSESVSVSQSNLLSSSRVSFDVASIADLLFGPIRSALDAATALEIEADPLFTALPYEVFPLDGNQPAFERWSVTRVVSLAHRYLAETRRVPWRQRLLTLATPASIDSSGKPLPYAWIHSLPGSTTGGEIIASGRDANLFWSGWTLALDGRHPQTTRLRPTGGPPVPGASLSIGKVFPADWSVACTAIESSNAVSESTPVDRFAALDLFFTGVTWGGCPSIVVGPSVSSSPSSSDAADTRVLSTFWRHIADESPARALQNALKELHAAGVSLDLLAGYRLWGHPGLSGEAARTFAAEEYQDLLGRAVDAHKRQDWAGAARAFQRALFLLDQIDPYDPQAIQIAELLAEDANLAGQYALGVSAAERVVSLREAFEAPPGELAAAWRLKGLLLSKDAQPEPAAEALRKAVELQRQTDDALALLNLLVDLGVVLENGEQYEQALDAFQQARQLCAEAEAYEEEAQQWRRIGRVLLLRLERWDEAAQAFDDALRLYTDLDDLRGQAECHLDIGQVHERRATFDRALESYDRAEVIAKQLDDKPLLARTALNQANTFWLTANYLDCLRRIERAMDLAVETENQPIELAAHNTAGLLRWALNDYDRALAEFDQALALSRGTGLRSEEASTLNNTGLVWRSRADYPKALETFGAALEIDRQTGSRWGQAYDHRNLGMTHLMAGDLNDAREQLQSAIQLSQNIGARTNYVKAVLSLADTHRKLGLVDEAEKGYQEALDESNKRGIREVEWRALQGLALVALLHNDRPAAIAWLDKAISLVEQMRASIRVEELQDGFLADKQGLYEQMILLLLDEDRVEDAFEYSERARGRNFIDLLGNQRLDLNNVADQRLIDRDREIRARITRLEADLAAAETDEQRQAVAGTLQAARNELADLLVEIRAHNPGLSAFVSVDPVSLQELYTLLGDGVSLVEYFLAEKETVVWVVRDGNLRVIRIPQERREVINLVTTYRRKIQGIEDVADLSRTLHDRLIAPVEPLIRGSKVLAIVPHNTLHYLAFASLSGPDGDLIDRYALFYLPSASVYRYTHGRRRPEAGLRVLAIGNPDLKNDALELPFAEKEAERLVWAFPDRVDVLTGERATERWVREHIADYGIIHVASHGEFDSVNPLFSAVQLAPDPEEDGRLTVREVFGLTLNADLVSLSACQSGLAKVNNGDDLVGLNRAFVYAGTHALLSSLWRVDDVATAVLVKHFYRGYHEVDKAEALRRAQVQVRRTNPHPAHWAGMVLTGDWK